MKVWPAQIHLTKEPLVGRMMRLVTLIERDCDHRRVWALSGGFTQVYGLRTST